MGWRLGLKQRPRHVPLQSKRHTKYSGETLYGGSQRVARRHGSFPSRGFGKLGRYIPFPDEATGSPPLIASQLAPRRTLLPSSMSFKSGFYYFVLFVIWCAIGLCLLVFVRWVLSYSSTK
ncbi:hypothetical protein HPB50_023638 [Hyalomma asiaticum]|uniref:Uncharacterized protein n=1 Tax=Hyalomma asiaticum TaxID=266040 RepID=A0ACB7T6B9_HYAAI|nr:hypothetical protein HPB50_023638 [Hyalomma asiaticum]